MKTTELSSSLTCMDLDKFTEQITFLNKHVQPYHMDIMGGHFVPNITLSLWFIQEVRKISDLSMSTHLMVEGPTFQVQELINIKYERICMYAEVLNGLAFRSIDQIHEAGSKTGVVLNPETPTETTFPYVVLADKIIIIMVDLGFAGQRFLEGTLEKIIELCHLREKQGYFYVIEMDGSSSRKTFKRTDAANPDIYVIGGSGLLTLDDDIEKSWHMMTRDYFKMTGKTFG